MLLFGSNCYLFVAFPSLVISFLDNTLKGKRYYKIPKFATVRGTYRKPRNKEGTLQFVILRYHGVTKGVTQRKCKEHLIAAGSVLIYSYR
ncbi:hypothetical protein BX666DRAFT_1898515 [Dichotomocladium elegans]|nr:hypothetical protein BX666DRAFT_1898515 [Dichotomocladium elegans]